MPLIPRGLTDSLFDRIRDRVRRELGVEPTAPTAGEPGTADPGFMSRIKQLVRERLGIEPAVRDAEPAPGGFGDQDVYYGPPKSLEDVKRRIQEAGRSQPPMLLRVFYNGQWRDLEPYSYRYQDKDDPHIPLFFAFCHKDQQIEAFKLKKIFDIQVTRRPYQPKWTVEF